MASTSSNTSLGGDRRIFVGTGVFVFVNIVSVMFNKISDAVLDGQPTLHPFIRCFLKSLSLLVFLLKVASDFSWSDFYCYTKRAVDSSYESKRNQGFSYSVLSQSDNNEEDDDQENDDGFDEVEHFSQDQSWVPTSKPGECSDSGSDRSLNGSLDGIDFSQRITRQSPSPKKRNKVRFSRFSEVRQLSSEEAQEATFSRLSYQASIRAEAEAIRLANRIKPWQTAILAVKLSIFSFTFQFLTELLTFTTELDFSPYILGLSCLCCLSMVFVFSSTRVSLNKSSKNASTDTLGWSILLTVISAVISISFVSLSLTSLPSLEHFQYLHSEFVQMLVSSVSFVIFVVLIRREVSDVDLLDIPLFLGLMGFFQCILFWPGFFFIPDLKVVLSSSLTGMAAVLLGDILFLALIDLLWTWATLSTSCLITMVGQMLRIPITTILSGSSEELTTLFWLGFLGICFSLASLTVFTNWTLIDSNVHYSFWNTSTSKRASKNEEKECLTLTQES